MDGFSLKLINWRNNNDYTQEQFSEICQISVRTVQSWENGKRLPGFDSLITLANTMGVSIDWLCGRTEYWQTIDKLNV